MSYIRCLSNPEALYIWSDGKTVSIWHAVKKPHSSGANFGVPDPIFTRCLKLWREFHEPATYKGMKVEELSVDVRNAEIIPNQKPCRRGCKRVGRNGYIPCKRCHARMFRNVRKSRYVIRLSYGKHFVDMWRVTWDYIAKHK